MPLYHPFDHYQYAVVDVETTGFNAAKDRIIEISIRTGDLGGGPGESFSTLVNPGISTKKTSFVHGITDRMLVDAPCFSEISGKVAELLSGKLWAAHSMRFDNKFVMAELERVGAVVEKQDKGLKNVPVICTYNASRKFFKDRADKPANHKLASCCRAFGIEFSDEAAHAASYDTEKTAELLLALVKNSDSENLPFELRKSVPPLIQIDNLNKQKEGISREQMLAKIPRRLLVLDRAKTKAEVAFENALLYAGEYAVMGIQ